MRLQQISIKRSLDSFCRVRSESNVCRKNRKCEWNLKTKKTMACKLSRRHSQKKKKKKKKKTNSRLFDQKSICSCKQCFISPYTHCQSAGPVPLRIDFPVPTVAPKADPTSVGSHRYLKYHQRPHRCSYCRSRRRPRRTKQQALPVGPIAPARDRTPNYYF